LCPTFNNTIAKRDYIILLSLFTIGCNIATPPLGFFGIIEMRNREPKVNLVTPFDSKYFLK
jgi:hypothetical protein